jgi:hypothetical protein
MFKIDLCIYGSVIDLSVVEYQHSAIVLVVVLAVAVVIVTIMINNV